MFKIYDGREQFYQWDIDRLLIIEDPSISQVHFCNRTDDCSLVCETYTIKGVTVVDVPNILLQSDWRIHVYAYDKNYTKYDKCFEVIPRTKPADYVYTETEILNYNTLLERMDDIDENIGIFVEDYLTENPVDLSDYYTREEVDEAISKVEVIAADVTFDDTVAQIGTTNIQEAIELLSDTSIDADAVQEQIDINMDNLYRNADILSLLTDDASLTGLNQITATKNTLEDFLYTLKDYGCSKYISTSERIYVPSLPILKRDYGFEKITKVLVIDSGGEVQDTTNNHGNSVAGYRMQAFMVPGILIFFNGHTTGADGEGLGYYITNNRLKRVREYLGYPNLLEISSGGGGGGEVDLSNYYTKSEVDTAIMEIELTPGPAGPAGPAGADGYTPVKGTDYFTEEDKTEIVNDVLAALPAAEEVSV